MPIVKLEVRRGRTPAEKRALLDAVHEALVECFKIPDTDRTQRICEHAPEDFEIPPGKGERYVVVELAVFPGRTLDAKRALYRSLVERFEALGVPRGDVMIVLLEVPRDNWGLRGGVPGSEVDLGFKLDV